MYVPLNRLWKTCLWCYKQKTIRLGQGTYNVHLIRRGEAPSLHCQLAPAELAGTQGQCDSSLPVTIPPPRLSEPVSHLQGPWGWRFWGRKGWVDSFIAVLFRSCFPSSVILWIKGTQLRVQLVRSWRLQQKANATHRKQMWFLPLAKAELQVVLPWNDSQHHSTNCTNIRGP